MIKTTLLLLTFLCSSFFAIGQSVDPVYSRGVSAMPEFMGGEEALFSFLAEHIEYPKEAMENNITGEVYAQFIVNKDGSISDIKIVRDIGGGCGEAVLEVIKKMPNWKPGRLGDKPVRVEYVLPVSFQMEDEGPYDKLSKEERKALRKKRRKLNRQSR